MDVLQRDDLHFPHSLPGFQRLFPDNCACAPIRKVPDGTSGLSAPAAKSPEGLTDSLCGFIESVITPDSAIIADDRSGYGSLATCGCACSVGGSQVAEEFLSIIHLVFSNLKTRLLGTRPGAGYQHLQACLNDHVSRFNRRFYPFNAHGFFPPRDMKHYHRAEKIMQPRYLFYVNAFRFMYGPGR
jgi:hypothetical protein